MSSERSGPDDELRLAMWSGPRNLSTAFMRCWENREDTVVVDEPFYAHYLLSTGIEHPGREEVLASQPTDWRDVVRSLLGPLPPGAQILFQKQMAHHLLPDMGRDWLDAMTHAFLIRDPYSMVASLEAKLGQFGLLQTGLPQQVEIFDHVAQRTGRAPPVLDTDDLLQRPEAMLRALCEALGVPFSTRMLSWPAGRRPTDGVWAKYWYERVEASTGFEPPPPAAERKSLPPALAALEARCRPLYERLRAQRLRA
jgi:hypothetical protein